jgi:hypothetical protein
MAVRARAIAIGILLTLIARDTVAAQTARPGAVVAGNAVLGGLTAAAHAAIARKPIGRALVTGVLGGLAHGAGKAMSPRAGIAAMAFGAVGTSVVANAGRGAPALDEVVLPLGPARLRVQPRAARPLGFAINGYETALLAHRALQPDTRVDWGLSRRAGTVVLRTSRALPAPVGQRAAALTAASTITLSDRASNPAESYVHERIHVQQEWFLQETWGRPVEDALRQRTPLLRRLPRWLELGVVPPTLLAAEGSTLGRDGPLRFTREWEAEALESLRR